MRLTVHAIDASDTLGLLGRFLRHFNPLCLSDPSNPLFVSCNLGDRVLFHLKLVNYFYAILIYQALGITDVVALVETVARPALSVAVSLAVSGTHM